jgi:hypothetical protein
MSYLEVCSVDSATSSGIFADDIIAWWTHDFIVCSKVWINCFSTSFIACCLVEMSAKNENSGDNDAIPIRASLLTGSSCDIDRESNAKFNRSHTLPKARRESIMMEHSFAVGCSL